MLLCDSVPSNCCHCHGALSSVCNCKLSVVWKGIIVACKGTVVTDETHTRMVCNDAIFRMHLVGSKWSLKRRGAYVHVGEQSELGSL
jgi:hypothetical protein